MAVYYWNYYFDIISHLVSYLLIQINLLFGTLQYYGLWCYNPKKLPNIRQAQSLLDSYYDYDVIPDPPMICWKTTGKHNQYVLYNFLFKSSHIQQKSICASTFYVSYKSFKTSRKASEKTYVTWTVPQPIWPLSKDRCLILIIII